jgi:hypothetical protein
MPTLETIIFVVRSVRAPVAVEINKQQWISLIKFRQSHRDFIADFDFPRQNFRKSAFINDLHGAEISTLMVIFSHQISQYIKRASHLVNGAGGFAIDQLTHPQVSGTLFQKQIYSFSS